ncbi:GNAT family N-acetyltransferase [Aliiglaciecola sp. 2_MG-2023]|uniref:GNAT family N-acetyltransferase n=1 Tax=unclassified Aliiglaciecola TaxID=2593648 RepID=UPI0026E37242|nr:MULTISPECIES: GNAT family N-acetyltransferase [unclassified Aliiglaciecola]MDO6709198.1 GNAT family N-acetyltransferase [Aliiglaciecola sp. 2_MG-2023]MDO6750346.1 GNAT family N-acetyltransferase [Aliiglaciecola sp. 1_MG-2023]
MNWSVLSCSEFSTHQQAWAELNNKTMNLAFFEPDFVNGLIAHFFDGDEKLVVAYKDDELQYAGFFKPLGKGRWATAMPSQCPLGLFLHHESQISSSVMKSLCNALPGTVAMLDMLQMDSKYSHFTPASDFEFMPYITSGNRPIPEDFDMYFQSLGKNMRQNYNKVINRAARAEDTLSWQKVTKPAEVKQAIIKYGELESRGWKGEEGTAISPDNTQGKFYQQALGSLAEKDKACCWYYLINDEIVAVDLCIQQDDCLIILKTTYNEQFNKQSPALMLKIEMIKYYSNHRELEGINNIEFYGKAMEWHKRLDSTLREIEHVTFYPSFLSKLLVKFVKKIK